MRIRVRAILPAVAIALGVLSVGPAKGQTSTGGLSDLSSLLNQFGGANGIQDLLNGGLDAGTSGTPDIPNGGDGGDGGTGGGMARSPIIQSNFGAHRGAAVAERAPSIVLRQSVAIIQGDTSFYTEPTPPETDSFYIAAIKETVRQFIAALTEAAGNSPLSNLLSSIGFGSLGSLTGSGSLSTLFQDPDQTPIQQGDITPLPNSSTSGQGTSEPIN